MDPSVTATAKDSIRDRMRKYFLVLSIVPLLVLGMIVLWQSYTIQREQAITLQRVIAESAAEHTRDYILSLENELRVTLGSTFFLTQDRSSQLQILRYVRSYHSNAHGDVFNMLAFVDKRGAELLRVSRTEIYPLAVPRDWSNAEAFKDPVKSGASHYSPVSIDTITGEPLMILGMPLMDWRTGSAAGVIIAEIRLKDAWHMLETITLGESGSLYFVDQRSRIIAHKDPSVVLRGTTFRPPDQAGIYSGHAGEKAVIATGSIALGDQKFFMVAERPLGEALYLTVRILSVIVVLLLAVLSGIMLLRWQIRQKILDPIESLSRTARAITSGDLTKQAELPSDDELGALAQAFNAMTARLVQTIDSLDTQQHFLRTVIESLAQPFYVIDADTYSVLLANKAAYVEGGLRAGALTCYAMTHDRSEPCTGDEHPCAVEKVKRTKQPAVLEHNHVTADGSKRIHELHVYPILNAERNVSHIIEYSIDITERRRAEEEMKKMMGQLLQMQKMEAIGTLAGGIAHDFNNILAAIVGYADFARFKTPADDKFRDVLDKIIDAGTRAKKLVLQILSFSRQTEEQRTLVMTQDLVREALELLRASIPRTVEIHQHIDDTCGPVLADPTQIHQVIMNLCTNASHAMREKGGNLTVTLHPVTIARDHLRPDTLQMQPGEYVRLEVSDTGHGIPPSIIDRIFDPFFTTKGVGEGSGMGLAVVHGIVKSHGGHIVVSSELDAGTTFTVYLPLHVLKPAVPMEFISADTSSVIEPPPGGHERILLIDDEEQLLRMEREMLGGLGYTVTAFSSSVDAFQAFLSSPDQYDLIITDLTMPDISGTELAGKILSVRPDMPIILSTGFSDIIVAEQTSQAGIRKRIMKPFLISDIALLIRGVLDERSQPIQDSGPQH